MSKRSYFSQYQSPNIVIVPTESISQNPPMKKAKLETQTIVEKTETSKNVQQPDNNIKVLSGKDINTNFLNGEDLYKTVKKTNSSWASNYLLSIGQFHQNPVKTTSSCHSLSNDMLNLKKNDNISTDQSPNVDLHTNKNKTTEIVNIINNISEYSNKNMRLTGNDSKQINDLSVKNYTVVKEDINKNKCSHYLLSDKNKLHINDKTNNDITSKSQSFKAESMATSAASATEKRNKPEKDYKSKITNKLKTKKNYDVNKNSDSDFEDQKYINTSNKLKRLGNLHFRENKAKNKTDKNQSSVKNYPKTDNIYKSDKGLKDSKVAKDSSETISNDYFNLCNKYKSTKKAQIITESKEKEPRYSIKGAYDTPNKMDKIQFITKQTNKGSNENIQCLKRVIHSKPDKKHKTKEHYPTKQTTAVKSVVQVTKHFDLNTEKNQDEGEKNIDLRTRLRRKNQRNVGKLSEELNLHSNYEQKSPLEMRDNLIITVNTQNEDNAVTSSPGQIKTLRNKTKRCKKIKLVINLICEKPLGGTLGTSSSETDDSDDDENVASCLLHNTDLSFLDDINVDEIVESLKHSKNDTDTIERNFKDTMPVSSNTNSMSNSLCYSDIKSTCSLKTVIKTEKDDNLANSEDLINHDNCHEVKFEQPIENKYKNIIGQRSYTSNALNKQVNEDKHKLAAQISITPIVPTIDKNMKQEILEDESKKNNIKAINIMNIKEEDEGLSDCSTVIIGELHSDIEEDTMKNIGINFQERNNVHKNKIKPQNFEVSIKSEEIEYSPDTSMGPGLTHISEQSLNESMESNNALLNNKSLPITDDNENKLKKDLPIKDDSPTKHCLVDHNEIRINKNQIGHSSALELNSGITSFNSAEITNVPKSIRSVYSISNESLKTNNKDLWEEIKIKNSPKTNNECVDQIKVNKTVTKFDFLDTNNQSHTKMNVKNTATPESQIVVKHVTSEEIKYDSHSISCLNNSDIALLPKASSDFSKQTDDVKVTNNTTEMKKYTDPSKIESKPPVKQTVIETAAEKQINSAVEIKTGSNSVKKEENEIKTKTAPFHPPSEIKTLSKQDQVLAEKLEKRMFEYLKTKYSVMSAIKKGKFSKIYRCKDSNGQNYAVKILNKECDRYALGIRKENMLMAIQKEIPRNNLNCVFIIDGFALNRYWCFLMEYYPKNLQQALQENNKSFHIDSVQNLSRQLVAAVTILRNHEIVHSDIKPSHILINSTNDRLKLCGFDSCYHINTVDPLPNSGTANYRAPEVILGLSAGYSLDVWSTALVMYEMSTNKMLFPGIYNNDILYKQMCTIGNIPWNMVEASLYKDTHFMETAFVRRVGVKGQGTVLIWQFIKSQRIYNTVIKSYHRDWSKLRTKQQQTQDLTKLRSFLKLLQLMLVMHPRERLPIEFAFANPFIYEMLA